MRHLVRLSILAAAMALGAGSAHAKKKVVVTAFSGPGGAAARAGLLRGLKRRVRLVSPRQYMRAAENVGADVGNAAGRGTVAAHLKLHAIVTGRVARAKRGRYTVTVKVYNGHDGEALGERTVRARSKRFLRRAGASTAGYVARLLRRAQVGKVAPAAPPPAPDPAPAPAPAPVAKNADADAQADAEAAAMRKKRDEDARLSAEAEGGARPRGLLQIAAAFGVAARIYKLEAQTAADNRTYDTGGVYPEITIALETYPLLLTTRGALAGLGLGASFSHHLSISTEQEATGQPVDSSAMELLVDLRYRWLISKRDSGPMVYGLAGYGMRSFDLAENDVLTSFSYQFINVALGGRVPLGTDLLALDAEVSLRPILKAGQEAVDAFGERSGGFAFGIRAGLSGRLPMGLFYFATFEFLTFPSDFAGLGSKLRPVELADPSSGTDTFIRVFSGVGYAL